MTHLGHMRVSTPCLWIAMGIAVCACAPGEAMPGSGAPRFMSGDGGTNGPLGMGDAATGPTLASCAAILAEDSEAPSGVYTVSPDGEDAFDVFCDMKLDGGGWTKVLQYADEPYMPSAAAFGEIATGKIDGPAKLSDERINAIAGDGMYVLKVDGILVPERLYIRTAVPFNDEAPGWGYNGKDYFTCLGRTFENCKGWTPKTTTHVDSLDWARVNAPENVAEYNNCSRYFVDYAVAEGKAASCFGNNAAIEAGQRCVSAGQMCTSENAPSGHPMIPYVSIWLR